MGPDESEVEIVEVYVGNDSIVYYDNDQEQYAVAIVEENK